MIDVTIWKIIQEKLRILCIGVGGAGINIRGLLNRTKEYLIQT